MKDRLTVIIAQLRQALERMYGEQLVKIMLFGSQARGDARPDSDIDILIVLNQPFNYGDENERISFPVAEICLEYNVIISFVLATMEQFQYQNSGFFRNVRREGIAV
ncbi:MAG: nucleotidyltransferase domain-containing protein [Hormoscilla sp. GM7CHS1pb]|nr:nucleotidyltransferase domain-containing protein [Hormoscilla sp. GM7CHS1pb]